jgi:outer membrane protein OmpA-like peptidoglycan-associated protein
MNRIIHAGRTLVAVGIATALLAACASTPPSAPGVAAVRGRLSALQADPNLASRAAVAVKEADTAVRLAETSQPDKLLAAHRVVMADRKVEAARALAETEFAEFERTALTGQRERARLDARTREVDAARNQARIAENAGAEQKLAADRARVATNAAQQAAAESQQVAQESRQQAAQSQQQAAELQRQLDDMNAKVTDRGLVLTLGDVLFTSGKADLKSGATGNLDKLAVFLVRYPERTATIEGYTDSLGEEDYNLRLSQQRAESVKFYLAGHGVAANRLAASGKGESDPVAGNESATGRQQNRRVQVHISEESPASR